jgi:hypothetical protein
MLVKVSHNAGIGHLRQRAASADLDRFLRPPFRNRMTLPKAFHEIDVVIVRTGGFVNRPRFDHDPGRSRTRILPQIVSRYPRAFDQPLRIIGIAVQQAMGYIFDKSVARLPRGLRQMGRKGIPIGEPEFPGALVKLLVVGGGSVGGL